MPKTEESSDGNGTESSKRKSLQWPTEQHIRHCMLYEFNQGHCAARAAKNISNTYKNANIKERKCQNWYRRFRNGELNLNDNRRSGRPRTLDDETLRKVVEQDPKLSIGQIADQLNSKWSTVQHHLAKLGMVHRNGKWVKKASGPGVGTDSKKKKRKKKKTDNEPALISTDDDDSDNVVHMNNGNTASVPFQAVPIVAVLNSGDTASVPVQALPIVTDLKKKRSDSPGLIVAVKSTGKNTKCEMD